MKKQESLTVALGICCIMAAALCGYLLAELNKSRNNERTLSRMVYETVRSTSNNTNTYEKK